MRVFVATLSLFLSAIATSQGAILVNYQFTPATEPLNRTATASDPGVVVSTVSSIGAFGVSTTSGTSFLRSPETGNSLIAALNDATPDYLEFTLTPAAGQLVNLTSFIFDHEASTNMATSFTSNLSIFASLDGFATAPTSGAELGTSTGTVAVSTGGMNTTLVDEVNFSLGAAQFQNLTSAQTVTFRVYAFDNFSANDFINRIDDIRVVGDVAAIPEPSSVLLVLGSAAGMFFIRRRMP